MTDPLTPIQALDLATHECSRRFAYEADSSKLDYWQTPRETEIRGRGDCDDMTVWTIARAAELCPDGRYRFVVGLAGPKRNGHAWVELVDGVRRWWSDPTWGKGVLERGVWGDDRRPLIAYDWNGAGFGLQTLYDEIR